MNEPHPTLPGKRGGEKVEEKSALEQKILAKARAAASEILAKEQGQVKHLLDQVRSQGKTELAAAMEQAKNRGEMIRKEYEASAHLEAKLVLLKKKDEIVSRVIAQAWDLLKVRIKRDDYREVLSRLVEEAVGMLGLSEAVLTLGGSERQIVGNGVAELEKTIASKLGRPIRLSLAGEALNSLGGVRVADPKGHLLYDNAWEARLERMRPELTTEVSEILFSGHASPQRSAVLK